MELSNVTTFLQDLEEIQELMKCQACNNPDKTLGRIKICGHYSCKTCLKKSDTSCPKCKIFCTNADIAWKNIFTESESIILNLKDLLLQAVKRAEPKKNGNTFEYLNKTYQINFIDDQRVNTKGETPLHVACKRKNVKDVKNLIKKQSDLNAQDFAGWVPLHEAIESGSKEIVEILLAHGALVDVPGEEYTTPLYKAVITHNADIVDSLLKSGANKNAVDFLGRKPVDYINKDDPVERLFNIEYITDRIEHLFCSKKIIAFCYYTELIYMKKLKQNKIKIEENYNPKKITHFIMRKNHKISVSILKAMLDGCSIRPQEWIDDYLKGNYFIDIPTYNFISLTSLNNGIRKATLNKLLRLPKLFDGMNFFITGHTTAAIIYGMKVSKDSLVAIITSGGGKVLHRAPTTSICEEKVNFPYHASKSNAKCCNYIIFQEERPPVLMYQMPELKHRSSKWLIDCAVNFTICD